MDKMKKVILIGHPESKAVREFMATHPEVILMAIPDPMVPTCCVDPTEKLLVPKNRCEAKPKTIRFLKEREITEFPPPKSKFHN